MASQAQKSPAGSLLLLLLLLGLLGLLLLALPSINSQETTSTQTTSEGQCLENGRGFNTPQEALALAKTAEQYRTAHPFEGNYGLGSYTICYKNGDQQRFQSDVYPGYDSKKPPFHITHSEQRTYKWLQDNLSQLSVDRNTIQAIYVVIFSQIVVCPSCRQDMVTWQKDLREKAQMKPVYLYIWDIAMGKGFNPAKYPKGKGKPVSLRDLERVDIEFVP